MKRENKNSVVLKWEFKISLYDETDPKSIPIIINSYNRLEYLEVMLDKLKTMGYTNIYVIDNKSKYKPLLRYYRNSPLNIFYLSENIGYLALWETELYKEFANSHFVYTDPDILPDEDCPEDFIERFLHYLNKYPELDKIGFGLRIDDLPAHYRLKEEVISHESKFWQKHFCDGLLDAPVDTTFALYRPNKRDLDNNRLRGARTDYPYVARHLPWYADSNNPTEEEKWYLNCRKKFTHWSNHPNNYSFFKKYFLLIKNDKLPIIWKIRKYIKIIITFKWLRKN